MTSKQQINAIASAVHVVEGFAAEPCADATVEEDILRIGVYAAAVELGQRLTRHFNRCDEEERYKQCNDDMELAD